MLYLIISILFFLSIDLTKARTLIIEKRFDLDDMGFDGFNLTSEDPWSDTTDSRDNSIGSQNLAEIPDSGLTSQGDLSDNEQYSKAIKSTDTNPCGTTDIHTSHIYLTCGGPAGAREGDIREPIFVANCVRGKLFVRYVFNFNLTQATGYQKHIPARGNYGPWNSNLAQFCCVDFDDKVRDYFVFHFFRRFGLLIKQLILGEQPDHWYATACILTPLTQKPAHFQVLAEDEWVEQILGGQRINIKVVPENGI